MAQRISRAKQRIRAAGAFEMPPADDAPAPGSRVLHVLYLIFNEGYTAPAGDELHRGDLTREAIRLARGCTGSAGRRRGGRPARADAAHRRAAHRPHPADGRAGPARRAGPVTLEPRRDRGGRRPDHRALAVGAVGPYQLQAAIAAVHAEAPSAEETDWPQILALYELLVRLAPNPIFTLNHAAAVAWPARRRPGLGAARRAGRRRAHA